MQRLENKHEHIYQPTVIFFFSEKNIGSIKQNKYNILKHIL